MEIVDIDELHASSSSLRMRLAKLSTQASHSIYKVPIQLRNVNNKSYEPQMISIVPYHHGKDKFKVSEELKLRYMQSLLDRKPDIPVERYFSAIARVEKKARNCYADSISLNEGMFFQEKYCTILRGDGMR